MSGRFIDVLTFLMVDRLVIVVGLTVFTFITMLYIVDSIAVGISMVECLMDSMFVDMHWLNVVLIVISVVKLMMGVMIAMVLNFVAMSGFFIM